MPQKALIENSPGAKNWREYLRTHGARTDRIGEVIEFSRYGDFPQNGKSKTWRGYWDPNSTKRPILNGVSVLEVVNGLEIYPIPYDLTEFNRRPNYRGIGEITGWGPDGEPLIKVLKIVK